MYKLSKLITIILLLLSSISVNEVRSQSKAYNLIREQPVRVAINLDDGRSLSIFVVRLDSAGLYVTENRKTIKAQFENNCAECIYVRYDQIYDIVTRKPNKVAGNILGGCLAGTVGLVAFLPNLSGAQDHTSSGDASEEALIGAVLAYGLGYMIGSNAKIKTDIPKDAYLRDRLSRLSAAYKIEIEKYLDEYGRNLFLEMIHDGKFNRMEKYKILIDSFGHFEGYIHNIDNKYVYFVTTANRDRADQDGSDLIAKKVLKRNILSAHIL